jgi:predicted DNA-binding protein
MKHLLNNMSEEEKNSIREQHSGGMKLQNEKFKKLVETKQGYVKPYLNESAEQMQANQMAQDLLDQVKKGSYRHLSVVTLGAGTEVLGALALLFASGVGTLPAMVMVFTGAAIVAIEGLLTGKDSGAGGVGEEIKQLQACLKSSGKIK